MSPGKITFENSYITKQAYIFIIAQESVNFEVEISFTQLLSLGRLVTYLIPENTLVRSPRINRRKEFKFVWIQKVVDNY